MVTDEQKYRAYTFNIAGFAMMTPLGKVFLEPVDTYTKFGSLGFVGYVCICVVSLLFGFVLIARGRDTLVGKGE